MMEKAVGGRGTSYHQRPSEVGDTRHILKDRGVPARLVTEQEIHAIACRHPGSRPTKGAWI
jgi:hypothetical protein